MQRCHASCSCCKMVLTDMLSAAHGLVCLHRVKKDMVVGGSLLVSDAPGLATITPSWCTMLYTRLAMHMDVSSLKRTSQVCQVAIANVFVFLCPGSCVRQSPCNSAQSPHGLVALFPDSVQCKLLLLHCVHHLLGLSHTVVLMSCGLGQLCSWAVS